MDVAKLVAVKAEEWQRRASKVMSQAKPQLDVVRELFEEGRELGYEESMQGVFFLFRVGVGVAVRFFTTFLFRFPFSFFLCGVFLVPRWLSWFSGGTSCMPLEWCALFAYYYCL